MHGVDWLIVELVLISVGILAMSIFMHGTMRDEQ